MTNYDCGCGNNSYENKMSSSRGSYSGKDDYSELIPRTERSNYELG
jgi:hypothetical protein